MRTSTPDKSRAKLACTVQAMSTRAYQRLSPAERRARNKILYARAKKRYQVLSLDEKRAHDEKKSARARRSTTTRCHWMRGARAGWRAASDPARRITNTIIREGSHASQRRRHAAKLLNCDDCVRCASHLTLHVSPRARRVTNWGGSARAAAKG